MKRRKAIGKAMAKRKSILGEMVLLNLLKRNIKKKKITGEGVDNKKLIKVFPDDVKEQMMEQGASMAKPHQRGKTRSSNSI